MEEIKDRIRSLVVEKLKLETVKPEEIKDDTQFFGAGLGLDSIDALELVVALEKEFGVTIADEEVGQKAFQNLQSLAAFIHEKKTAA